VRYTLTSATSTLGITGIELPAPAPGMRCWQFLPAPAFAQAAPVFAGLPAAIADSQEVLPTASELEAIPEHERAEHMRQLLLADPRMARFLELSEQLDALELVLRDTSGTPVPTKTIGVTELSIPAAAFREMLSTIDPDADLSTAAAPPFHLLVVGLD
jgi:hypothetical protein